MAGNLGISNLMGFSNKKAAEKRRLAFKEGLVVKCGGYIGTILKVGDVKEAMRMDMNMKVYGKPIYDFSIVVNTKMPNGKATKQLWLGSHTSIPRRP